MGSTVLIRKGSMIVLTGMGDSWTAGISNGLCYAVLNCRFVIGRTSRREWARSSEDARVKISTSGNIGQK